MRQRGVETGRRRVVVTGMDVVTPLGLDLESSWAAAVAGVSGIGPITLFDASTFPCRIAGQVKGFPRVGTYGQLEIRNRGAAFGVAAAAAAVERAGTHGWPLDRARVGVSMGCGRPAPDLSAMACLLQGEDSALPTILGTSPIRERSLEAGAHEIAQVVDARGPNYSIYTACASSAQAIGQALRCIQRGDADVMIAGGYDSMVNELGIVGFALLRALSTSNVSPERACRPFDRDRSGLVLGEGAGVLVLEEMGGAQARGARIMAEVCGYGASMNAYRITDPDPEAEGPARAMSAALTDAVLSPSDIGYINAHGTGTRANDPLETVAIKRVFGRGAYEVPISSTKSTTGHLMAAAGAVESAFCVLSIRDNMVPPTVNLEKPDRSCDLDYVPQAARRADVQYALSNSFGFGGTNACLIFARLGD